MSAADPVLAIALSDVHLSLRPPVAREEEPDWFAAIERPWTEIKELQRKHNAIIICAGDIFDRWNSPPELINWALRVLPGMYAIPGNHDLPSHRPEGIDRSAYGTLVKANRIVNLTPNGHGLFKYTLEEGVMRGIPFGINEVPPADPEAKLNIAVIHEYMWIDGHSYPGAPKEQRLSRSIKRFAGYDVVIVGDNHKGFKRHYANAGLTVLNCGTLMRRKSNEANYKPWVGLIHASGKVSTHYLDTSQDIMTVLEPQEEQNSAIAAEISDFLDELSNLQATRLDFRTAMERTMDQHQVNEQVRTAIREAME